MHANRMRSGKRLICLMFSSSARKPAIARGHAGACAHPARRMQAAGACVWKSQETLKNKGFRWFLEAPPCGG
jgi:hypothetical protein